MTGRTRAAVRTAPALCFLCLLGVQAPAEEFTGVRGMVSLDGKASPGIRVFAFREFDAGLASEPFARSEPSRPDGRFSLDLPAGSYIVVAAGTKDETPGGLREGDLFCFYGGNPVRVDQGKSSVLGLSVLPVARDPAAQGSSGISGEVYDERGNPLPGAVVYAYKNPAEGFKGVPGAFARTKPDGTFQLRATRGTFFLVVRKRESGEMFGPTSPGDHFGYYPRNPVSLVEGAGRGVRIDAQRRQSAQEKLGATHEATSAINVRAIMVDPEGRPVSGIRLLAYRESAMTGFPAYISGRSGKDGTVELTVAEEGTYYLLAREKLGGPAEEEWFGKYAGTPDHSVPVSRGAAATPLRIVLERR